MRLVKDYMRDETLRHALNDLTEATFGFNFESWVVNGFFEGDYIPYSLEEDGKILSNVSVNLMQFVQNGEKKNYIQLGTVMTDIEHRKEGLARRLMEYVLEEYEGKCDGIYLFGNLDVLEFYRKMGFEERMQYQYTLKDNVRLDIQGRMLKQEKKNRFEKLDSSDAKAKEVYYDAVRKGVVNSAFEQVNKYGLQMFYTAGLDDVYYSKDLDCFAVIEQEGDTLWIHSIISSACISLETIISAIDLEYKELKLGFTPRQEEADLFDAFLYDGGDDYRLFCRGSQLESIEKERLYFPTFSHA